MSFKHDNTSKIIEKCIAAIDANAPINISFMTRPISKAFVDRVKSLEKVYSQSRFYQFLIKKGIYPALLFSIVSGCIGYGVYRTYHRSTKLVLNLLGVVYPTYCCWHLVKSQSKGQQEEKLKSWLTYWMLFGSFQVLDHCIALEDLLVISEKYSLYKLLILYWAQSPHSNGALLLYRHVIQKPVVKPLDREGQKEEQQHVESYRILDYNNLTTGSSIANIPEQKSDGNNSSSSSSSSDDDSVGLQYRQQHQDHHSMNHSLSTDKEIFPPLLMNGTEAAW